MGGFYERDVVQQEDRVIRMIKVDRIVGAKLDIA